MILNWTVGIGAAALLVSRADQMPWWARLALLLAVVTQFLLIAAFAAERRSAASG